MGIDQMRGTNFVWIARRFGNDRRTIHFEIVESLDPWERCSQLMVEYDVACCVCDAMPNANEALRFAKKFDSPSRKVWLAWWGNSREMAQWSDKSTIPKRHRRVTEETYHRWTVFFDKYQAIDHALGLFRTGQASFPDPDALVQGVQVRPDEKYGPLEPMRIFRDFAWLHLKSVVREEVPIDETVGKYRYQWKYLGIEPHALDAWTYCAMAMERTKPAFSFGFV